MQKKLRLILDRKLVCAKSGDICYSAACFNFMKAFDQDTDHGYYGTNRSAHLVSNILIAIFYIL